MPPKTQQSNGARAVEKLVRVQSLIADLASTDSILRTKAREALVAIGKPSVPRLIPLLTHRTSRLRWEAAKALVDIADPISASALVCALDDRDGDVRWLAAEGLIAVGKESLHPLLAALLLHAQSCWLCEGAHHVCHALVKRKILGPILRPVLAALSDSEPAVAAPVAAYDALARLREVM